MNNNQGWPQTGAPEPSDNAPSRDDGDQNLDQTPGSAYDSDGEKQ